MYSTALSKNLIKIRQEALICQSGKKGSGIASQLLKTNDMQANPGENPMGNTDRDQVPDQFDSNFRPIGAIAFFIALVITGLVIWFSIYFLMLERL
jgi:hypothetical protein